jgi:thiamine transport system ATP-binding protein
MLIVESVAINYPGFDGLYDFTLPRGTLAAVIGPSGGGKTTLFNALGGFETPISGRMTFNGVDFTTARPAARPTAMLFQDHNLFPHLNAVENVALGMDPGLRLDPSQWREAEQALAQTGLGGMARRLPAELSGGQRQRVALARALVRAKPILLLDEPFGALDPGLRKEMIALVDALRQARGFTVLMSLHTPDDALGLADRMVFIAEGRIQLNETPERVLHSGASEIRRFLGR